jgi:hypothetical protein
MRILWIEDQFSEQRQQAWFGELPDCSIEPITDYSQAKQQIDFHLTHYDLVVLDINLEESQATETVLDQAQGFDLDGHSFLKEAGFHLYIQLLEAGYDKNRIVFFTGNVSETPLQRVLWLFRQTVNEKPITVQEQETQKQQINRLFKEEIGNLISRDDFLKLIELRQTGDDNGFWHRLDQLADAGDQANNTYNQFKRRFKEARLRAPHAIRKSSDQQIQLDIHTWLHPHLSNLYLRLRFAMVEMACHIDDTLVDDDQILVNRLIAREDQQLSQDDLRSYFWGLAALLPQREPIKEQKQTIYCQLLRALLHEWDGKLTEARQNSMPSILRSLRNWMAHGKAPESITETLLGYLFWLNCRSMFQFDDEKLQPVERHLLPVFGRLPDEQDFLKQYKNCRIAEQWKSALRKRIEHFNGRNPQNPVKDEPKDKSKKPRSIEEIKSFLYLADTAKSHPEFDARYAEWLWDGSYGFFWEKCGNQSGIGDQEHHLGAMARCLWLASHYPHVD